VPAFTISIGPNTVTKNIQAEDITRLINAYKALYADRWVSGNPPTPFTPTNAQIFQAFAEGIFQGVKNTVLQHEREAAKAAAGTGVADIPLT
jgi:hypothetical protein